MASSLEGLATKLRNIQDEIVEGIANDTVKYDYVLKRALFISLMEKIIFLLI